jgi:hypothetical protein
MNECGKSLRKIILSNSRYILHTLYPNQAHQKYGHFVTYGDLFVPCCKHNIGRMLKPTVNTAKSFYPFIKQTALSSLKKSIPFFVLFLFVSDLYSSVAFFTNFKGTKNIKK